MSETREYVLYCRWDDVRNGLRRVAFSDRPSRSHFDAVVVRLVAETEKLCQCGHEEREHTKDGTCFGGGASCQCNDFRLRVTLLPSVARAPDATQEIEALRADAERWRFAAKYGVDMECADSVYVYRGPADTAARRLSDANETARRLCRERDALLTAARDLLNAVERGCGIGGFPPWFGDQARALAALAARAPEPQP